MESPVLLRRFGPGETVADPHDVAEAMFIVHTGGVEVQGLHGPPRQLGPGEMFGETALILGETYGMRAVAVEETALVVVKLPDLQRLCLRSHDFVFRLIRHVAEQARWHPTDERSAMRERGARLARVILGLAADGETPARVDGRLLDLAEAADLPIEEAYVWVQQWLEERTLRLAEDQLTLVDREILMAVADGVAETW
jgi:CRP-like cAMP-binding protein